MGIQPGTKRLQQGLGMCGGHRRHLGVDNVAAVVDGVALAAQRVQHDPGVVRDAQGQRQALDHHLVMPRLAGGGAVAARHHGRQRALHDGLVGGVETRLVTDGRDARISQVALGAGQQALDLGGRGGVFLETADLLQVLQGHARFPSERSWPRS